MSSACLQAAGLEPILRSKARQWAAASNGRAGGHGSAEEGAGARSRLKSVRRAVEKLVRSYDSDVSRLVGRRPVRRLLARPPSHRTFPISHACLLRGMSGRPYSGMLAAVLVCQALAAK
jgi:hypothetical protein